MKNLAIIQARMGSKRLPGKVLMDLAGKPVIQHVVERVSQSKTIDKVVVATSVDENNLNLIEYCARKKIQVFVGSEDDVLDRYYQAAKLFKPENIVRITADCPLMDPAIVDKTVESHLNKKTVEYTTNTLQPTYPDGEDVEVFTWEALEISWQEAKLLSEREHVTPYIRNNPTKFRIHSVENEKDFSGKRWTLDTQEDYKFIASIFNKLYGRNPFFGMSEILALLNEAPDLETINSHFKRNENYEKSMQNDKVVSMEK